MFNSCAVALKMQFAEVWSIFCVMEIDNLRDQTLP